MNKVKLILLAASLSLVMVLTLSCSDDKDGGNKADVFGCRPGAKNLCSEMPVNYLLGQGATYSQVKAGMKESCETMNDDPEHGIDVGIFYENGCPGGSVLECDCQKVNSGECQLPFSKYYFYDAQYKDLTCEEIFK
jgi:hypothetical protein